MPDPHRPEPSAVVGTILLATLLLALTGLTTWLLFTT